MRIRAPALLCLGLAVAGPLAAQAPARPRARDLGIPLEGTPGPLNAITDVRGVEVGHATIIRGQGRLTPGRGPIRTGVTAVLPRGKDNLAPVFAGWFTLNGNGEMTGTTWVEESGLLASPVMITNTLSVGVVRDATVAWAARRGAELFEWALPVVAETWDNPLNDIAGQHVTREHAWQALASTRSGPVAEGNVGGGTGMVCHQFKGGIGTSSRRLTAQQGGYTLGVLVQCNYGGRERFSVLGVPVGKEINDLRPCASLDDPATAWLKELGRCPAATGWLDQLRPTGRDGSIIIVIATDAPLLPHQLKRLAKRAALGVGRMGGLGEDSSGDIFIAFSTAPVQQPGDSAVTTVRALRNETMNPLFRATVEATEEAILNAMVAAETMTGADGFRVYALPHDRLVAALRKYGRMP